MKEASCISCHRGSQLCVSESAFETSIANFEILREVVSCREFDSNRTRHCCIVDVRVISVIKWPARDDRVLKLTERRRYRKV
jgi:hypothetical protein